MHIRFFATVSVALAMWASAAEPVDLEQLMQELRKTREQLSTKETPDTARALRDLSLLDSAIQSGDITGIRGAIARLLSLDEMPAAVTATLERLQKDVPQLLLQAQDRFVAEVDQLAEKARQQILASATEKQLRPLLREMEALSLRKPGGSSALAERAQRKLSAMERQVQVWMDISLAKEAGSEERALQMLQGLMTGGQDFPLIPFPEIRKEIAKIAPTSPAAGAEKASIDPEKLLQRIRSLDDVPTLAAEIAAIPNATRFGHMDEYSTLKQWANILHVATVSLRTGDIGSAWQRAPQLIPDLSHSWVPEALRIRELLMQELLPKYLQLPPDKHRRPEETPADFLQRLTHEAAAEKRWEEVLRLMRTSDSAYRRMDLMRDQMNSIIHYLEGQSFEAAGELARAANSYRMALRSTGPLAPVADASARLKALQKDHPELLEEARKQMEEQRLLGVVQQAEILLSNLNRRMEALEASRGMPPGRPPMVAPANNAAPDQRIVKLEQTTKRLEELAAKLNTVPDRLSKIETMFGPALENAPAIANAQVKLWLGPDYTVYRTALPPQMEKGLTWAIRFNGKFALNRNAEKEMQYQYSGTKPGNYSIELTLGEKRISNVIEYTLTPEIAKKLKPAKDDDWDRDGVPNGDEGN